MTNFYHEIKMFYNEEDIDRNYHADFETELNLPFRLKVGDTFKFEQTRWMVVESTYCLDSGEIFINAILK